MPGLAKLRKAKLILIAGLAGVTTQTVQATDRQWLSTGVPFGPRAHLTEPARIDPEAAAVERRVDRASVDEPSALRLSMEGSAYDHNGSQVTVVPEEGLIAYVEPKPALHDVARAGTVIFRGRSFSYSGKIKGTAYAFKRGCPPAPYAVSGGYSADNTTIVLRGAAPIRKGCEITGYSARSPHAVLRFKSLMS